MLLTFMLQMTMAKGTVDGTTMKQTTEVVVATGH